MGKIKSFISYLCILSLLVPQSSYSYSIWGFGSRTGNLNAVSGFTQDELKFIVAYKSYTKQILHIQAAEAKKKIICLGFDFVAGFEFRNDPTWNQRAQDYKNSAECAEFLRTEVPKLVMAYSEMRVNLALHQSDHNEIQSKLMRPGSMGMIVEDSIDCSRLVDPFGNIVQPLGFGPTDFCFSKIQTVMDTTPRHILRKASIGFLDDILDSRDLPEVAVLPPLSWEETQFATLLFQEKYVGNQFNLENTTSLGQTNQPVLTLEQKIEQSRAYPKQQKPIQIELANYYSASNYQSHGSYVFSQYPEDSAPRKYMELISQYPVLAFYEPNYVNANLECNSAKNQSENTSALCLEYLKSLPRLYGLGISLSVDRNRDVHPKLAIAYKKVLDLNQQLIASLDIKFNSENMFDENKILIEGVSPENIENWSDLLALDLALKNFLEMFPEYQGQETRFVAIKNRRETQTLVLMIGAAVGIGLGCGLMGGWPLVACLGVAGIGANVAFYDDTLHRHNGMMLRYFSTSTEQTTNGLKLGLVEFEAYKSEVQGLFLDMLFLGVGTGAGQMVRSSKTLLKAAERTAL